MTCRTELFFRFLSAPLSSLGSVSLSRCPVSTQSLCLFVQSQLSLSVFMSRCPVSTQSLCLSVQFQPSLTVSVPLLFCPPFYSTIGLSYCPFIGHVILLPYVQLSTLFFGSVFFHSSFPIMMAPMPRPSCLFTISFIFSPRPF